MDEDFAVSCPLVRPGLPDIRFVFVRSRFGSALLSDAASRRRPCASLALHLHQVVQGTCTPRLSNMLGTRLNRSAVGKTQVSFTSRRPQQLAPSTLTSLLACTNALRRAILRHGYAWRQPRSDSSLRGRPALFPERAPCPSIQSTLKQKLCPSRLRPPRLHPQGRRGLSSGRARLRPCGYNILQCTNASQSRSARELEPIAGRIQPEHFGSPLFRRPLPSIVG